MVSRPAVEAGRDDVTALHMLQVNRKGHKRSYVTTVPYVIISRILSETETRRCNSASLVLQGTKLY